MALMKYLPSCIISLLFFGFAFEAIAQTRTPRNTRRDTMTPMERARETEANERRRYGKVINDTRGQNSPLNSELPKGKIEYFEKSLTPAQKKLLEPAPEDYQTFADFLRQPDTGLIRLMP